MLTHNISEKDIYEKISAHRGLGVRIKRNLCFYSPAEVLNGLTQDGEISRWLSYIENHYCPPSRDLLLIYPCSTEKPYHKSRSYRQLYKTLSQLGEDRARIHLITISEPFGLVPEEFYSTWRNWYDCPGLFEWWCGKYGLPYSEKDANRCIEILANCVAKFLLKTEKTRSYSRMLAFVRTYSSSLRLTNDHTHRRILEKAVDITSADLEILPNQGLVKRIVREKGRLAWDMYGVSHPMSQRFLLDYVKNALMEARN